MRVYEKVARLIQVKDNKVVGEEAQADLEDLVLEYLPQGSGFDNGCEVDIDASTPDRLVIHTSFHHISDNGFYLRWTDHDVIVTPSLILGFDLRVTGRDYREIKGYIADMFSEALDGFLPYNDKETRLISLAAIVRRFLHKEAGFTDLHKAIADLQGWL